MAAARLTSPAGIVVQLLSVIFISILVAVATVVRHHVELSSSSTSTSSLHDASAAAPHPKVELPPPSKRIKNQITSLEHELKTLQNEVLSVTEELRDAMAKSDISEKTVHKGVHKQQSDLKFVPLKENNENSKEQSAHKHSKETAPLPPPASEFKEREPKKWWIRQEVFPSPSSQYAETDGDGIGSIIPIDLSVNHLQRIDRAPGSPNEKSESVQEDFLPVVLASDIDFRWRSRARENSRPEDVVKTTAYQIVARRAYSNANDSDIGTILWDSGKVATPDGLPDVVVCENVDSMEVGSIVEWSVTAWDFSDKPTRSSWSKFAIGPKNEEWEAKWVSHPVDIASFDEGDSSAFWVNGDDAQQLACDNWMRRKQLPLFRAKLPALDDVNSGEDKVITALLVVSGLGSFRASVDGEPLSSSGPLDPPLTDYAQRVSYRGFDVTKFLTGDGANNSHVIGISMGSGWWDHRPIKGSFIRLFFFPRGAITAVAQLYVTYKSGKTKVMLPTGDDASGWQVAKGHLRESSLFTGEYIDLESMKSFDGWDTEQQWATISPMAQSEHSWTEPVVYQSDSTLDLWRYQLHVKASAAYKNSTKGPNLPANKMAPIGKLVPHEAPPVLPIEKIYPDEVYSLGNGRWMIDFGKAFSGMVRFEEGLPNPIVPTEYPRGHTVNTLNTEETFITVLYGERLELTTGDLNLPVVAGMGLHDGGPKHKSKPAGNAEAKGGVCYPKDHVDAGSLMQRDVYILPRKKADESIQSEGSFSDARQSHFTTHSFRFAEICCIAEPPTGMYALSYRTAFSEWGDFSSSNVRINGGYELVKNAFNSNLLSVQSDCPHREKIQYGGDINANAPAALHLYDLSAFYRKVVYDWRDQQWDNGAYSGTSYWLALNDYAGIGQGAGETVWATAPPLITVRHMQHYGDTKLLEQTFSNHLAWLNFLRKNFDAGLKQKGYDDELVGYVKEGSGLGDWLTMRGRDTWLTHESFYMAVARCVAYIAKQLGTKSEELDQGLATSKSVEDKIARLYLKNGNDHFLPPDGAAANLSPGPEMSLYSRVVPAAKRCTVLRNYFRRKGHTWPGSEESRFIKEIPDATVSEMVESTELSKRGSIWAFGWSQWHGFNEGIFAIRYALKTLSDNGFHNVALDKANGFSIGTFEYMLSHNATTHWESWWRSEDLYSHNHPMLGASAEWMASSVAGVSLYPTTTGGKEVLFWPRFPNSANYLYYASATQVYVPPDGKAFFRMPEYSNGEGVDASIKYATVLPNMEETISMSKEECQRRRKSKDFGFNYNWEMNRKTEQWEKIERKKAIGTSCESFLFHSTLGSVEWSSPETVSGVSANGIEVPLGPGLYDVLIDKWQLKPEVKKYEGRIGDIPDYYNSEDVGPYCADSDTLDWNIEDATYLI
ncbi:predicted protein [Thalassiosira pseudonana CCMP1335]|uniref:alpha-L-rhamnosidase n=1 Tax=Thalassiosira pseudonana TaxID=35128 RepID=B8C127_THAPS|nr:predicted protein [Thalassiosira pseudonana CCMP1335]EED93166.1 predicted protein [Thalassiosira pseudonana CCMP1335]